MKVEFCEVAPKKAEVPVVLGGVYLCLLNHYHYMLSRCRTGGYQLHSLDGAAVLSDGPFDTHEGVRRYLNDSSTKWQYIPGAVLTIPKEVG